MPEDKGVQRGVPTRRSPYTGETTSREARFTGSGNLGRTPKVLAYRGRWGCGFERGNEVSAGWPSGHAVGAERVGCPDGDRRHDGRTDEQRRNRR